MRKQVCCYGNNGGLACLPTVIIAGFQKGGTTALGALLDAHPNIAMARVKETHFFDKAKVSTT
jgi:Sulfotransferase domain